MAMAQGEHAFDGGRASFGRQAWGDAYAQLSAADKEAPLEFDDLERLAVAAYLVGRVTALTKCRSSDRSAAVKRTMSMPCYGRASAVRQPAWYPVRASTE
jgi:hypothetical protein